MNNLSGILRKVLNNKYDFCCLCFKTIDEHPIHFEDDVVIYQNNIRVADVLCSVLGDEIYKAMSTFEVVCTECVSVAASSYSFITASRRNARRLRDLLDQLHNGFRHAPAAATVRDSRALFVSLPPDLSSHLYYTNKRVKSTQSALSKLKEITESLDRDLEPNEDTADVAATVDEPATKNYKYTRKAPTRKILKSKHRAQDRNDYRVVKCKHCLKVYTGLHNLRSHHVRVHAPKVHECTVCRKGFGSAALVELHREESHASLECGQCGLALRNRHRLRQHERAHHAPAAPAPAPATAALRFSCPDCGRVFRDADACQQHVTFELCRGGGGAVFTCDHCQKTYTQKASLRAHIAQKHLGAAGAGGRYGCEACPRRFQYRSALRAHARAHTGEKNFRCSVCDERFATKQSLQYHARSHLRERTFACPRCPAHFLSRASRAEHAARHGRERAELCDICHARFPSRTYLERHRKLHLDMLADIGFRLRAAGPVET